MDERYVFIVDIARMLKKDKSGIRERLRREGVKIVRLRRKESGLPALAVAAPDAKKFIELEQGGPVIVRPEDLFD